MRGAIGWKLPDCYRLSHVNLRFGRDHVQGHIPGARLECLHPLALVGDTDQERTVPAPVPAQIGEGAVVVAATHSQSVAVGIEADEWDQQQVQGPGKSDTVVAQLGLGNAEAVFFQWTARGILQKPELSAWMWPEYWKEAAFVAGVGQLQEGEGIDFAVRAPVSADAASA